MKVVLSGKKSKNHKFLKNAPILQKKNKIPHYNKTTYNPIKLITVIP